MSEQRWVWDSRAMELVEVEIVSLESDDPMTRGLIRFGHLGVGFRSWLPADKAAAIAEAHQWLDARAAELDKARCRLTTTTATGQEGRAGG